jgi:hypothetical protein
MSQKPSSFGTGVTGTTGTAAQTVATTKYSVGTSFRNRYGDRYAMVTVKSSQAFDLYVFGSTSDSAFSSAANGTGVSSGKLLFKSTGNEANGTASTGPDGKSFWVPIAGFHEVLPIVYQASGSNATVTTMYQTFNG